MNATYVLISIPFILLAAIAWVAAVLHVSSRKRFVTSTLVALMFMLVLTAVFDSVIVGMGLVGYDPELTSGILIWMAPIEDFTYTVAACLGLPGLWVLLNRERHDRG